MKKIKYVYTKGKLNVYLHIPIINGCHRGKTEGCYVDTNNVYVCRMNGYQIVLIDGYDRLETKHHGTANNCHGIDNLFAAINCCKKKYNR